MAAHQRYADYCPNAELGTQQTKFCQLESKQRQRGGFLPSDIYCVLIGGAEFRQSEDRRQNVFRHVTTTAQDHHQAYVADDWLNGNQTASRVGYEQVCLVTK